MAFNSGIRYNCCNAQRTFSENSRHLCQKVRSRNADVSKIVHRPGDAQAVREFLRGTTLVGALPPPSTISPRIFRIDEETRQWLNSYTWGCVWSNQRKLYSSFSTALFPFKRKSPVAIHRSPSTVL